MNRLSRIRRETRPASSSARRFLRCRRAATAAEFALVFPVFMALVIGSIEISRAMWIKATIQFAAEQTTRYAIVNTSASLSDLETYAETQVTNTGLDSSDMTFTATSETTADGKFTIVTITQDFSLWVSYIPFPSTTLSGTSRIPISGS